MDCIKKLEKIESVESKVVKISATFEKQEVHRSPE
jgi:hypothetical protein